MTSLNSGRSAIFYVRNLAPSNVTQIETSIQDNVPEVQSVSVNLALEHIKVTLEEEVETRKTLLAENAKSAIFLKIQNEITDNLGLEVTNMEEIGFESTEGTFRKGVIYIQGMHCSSCTNTVESLLMDTDGVKSGTCSLVLKAAQVLFDDKIISLEDIAEEIDDLGFEIVATELVEDTGFALCKCYFKIQEGMIPYNEFENILAITNTSYHKESDILQITYDAQVSGVRDFEKILDNSNCTYIIQASSTPYDSDSIHKDELKRWRRRFFNCIIFAIPVFLISMVFEKVPAIKKVLEVEVINYLSLKALILWILVTPVQFGPGLFFYKTGWSSLKHGSPNMAVLVSLGTTAAYLYSLMACLSDIFGNPSMKGDEGFFETSSTLITVVVLGKFMECITKGQTAKSMSKLIDQQEKVATVVTLDSEGTKIETQETMDVLRLHLGDTLLIERGGRLPVDGTIKLGRTSVDESAITGEPLPKTKGPGDRILCGSVNVDQPVIVDCDTVGNQTTISVVINLMKQAQADKVPIQRFADYVSSIFVPTVLVIALLTFTVWYTIIKSSDIVPKSWYDDSNPFLFSLLFCVAVLVIACPCALGLASPTALMVGTGVALRNGILIKNGASLQTAKNVGTVVFDKTGTLTKGKPALTKIDLFSKKYTEDELLTYASSAEIMSEHILGKAIVKCAQERECNLQPSNEFEAVSGMGIRATVDGLAVVVGNASWLQENSFPITKMEKIKAMQREGKTVLLVGLGDIVAGTLSFEDEPRPEAKYTIENLKKCGIKVCMLTGDNRGSALSVASKIGIEPESVFAEVLPQDKHERILHLQETEKNGKAVAMVGDGINDAAALAKADIAFSIGTGTEIAMEASDMVLMKNDLTQILNAIDLSQKVLFRIKLNFFWALIFNSIGIPVAAGVLYPFLLVRLPPVLAASAMACSSVLVVSSSLHLNFYKPPYSFTPVKDQKQKQGKPCTNCPCCCSNLVDLSLDNKTASCRSPIHSPAHNQHTVSDNSNLEIVSDITETSTLLTKRDGDEPRYVCQCINCHCQCSRKTGEIVKYMSFRNS